MKMGSNYSKLSKKFEKKYMKLIAAKEDEINKHLLDTAKRLQASAILKSPTDTGNLRKNIKLIQIPDGYEVYVDTTDDGAPYGLFIELGTRKMAAQPFLRPAANEVKPFYIKGLDELLK